MYINLYLILTTHTWMYRVNYKYMYNVHLVHWCTSIFTWFPQHILECTKQARVVRCKIHVKEVTATGITDEKVGFLKRVNQANRTFRQKFDLGPFSGDQLPDRCAQRRGIWCLKCVGLRILQGHNRFPSGFPDRPGPCQVPWRTVVALLHQVWDESLIIVNFEFFKVIFCCWKTA